MTKPTYREHMTATWGGKRADRSNYLITCSCGWDTRLAAISDVKAAELALEHVKASQQPAAHRG
jgi:hypothetical protein